MRRIFILFYDEGVDATVSVEGFRGELSLLIDGKADASTGNQDMRTQVLLAQVPMLLHPDPDTVLVIGLGSGISLGSIETHEVEWIDCVELLDNVVEASGLFSEYNFDCLGDPRVHMIIGDGRNHVLLTDRKYDAIISHPTNPWISGVGDLFTQEFFQLARRRLRPGGLMCSWFHTYHMGEQDVRALVGTFVSVFPHASMWLQDDGNIILVGSVEPMVIDAYLASRMAVPEVVADLRRVRTESPLDLVANYVAGSQSLGRYAEPAGNFNTDDNMLLEFSAGRRGFESTVPEQIANFIDLIEFPPLGPQSGFDSVGIAVRMEARKLALEGTVIMSREGVTAAMPLFERAYALSPSEAYVEQKYIEGRLILAQACLERGDYTNARENYLAALVASDHPYAWRVYLGLGMSLAGSGDTKGALESFAASIRLNPDNPVAYHNLGILKRVTGNMGEAVTALEQALRLEPDPDVASDLSRIYMEMGVRLGEAARLAEQAVTWRASAEHYITLGWAQNRLGHDREAEQAMLEALKLEADNTEAMYALATMKLARNDLNGAVEMLQETVRLGRRDRYSDLAARKLRELKVQ